MTLLRLSELRRFADATGALAERPSEQVSLSNFLLGVVAQLIPLDRVSYNELDRTSGRLVTAHSMNEAENPSLVEGLNRHIHEHPGFAHTDPDDPWPTPVLLSDYLSQRQFRKLGLYQEHFRLYGIHYQLGASFVVSPERRVSFCLNRASRDFREEDRLMLSLLRQHLAAAWRRAAIEREINRRIAMQDMALTHADAAVILLSSAGEVVFRTPRAEEMLVRYNVALRLLTWARTQATSAPSGRVLIKRQTGRLLAIVTRAPRPGGWHLLRLVERRTTLSSRPLEVLGLARREAEALFWLARGKRNSEIAAICGMRLTTVGTHLRSIFAKLGVETRTAAAAVVWETLADALEDKESSDLPTIW